VRLQADLRDDPGPEGNMRRFALVLAVLVGCGGDDDGGPVSADDLPDALVNAFCNYYVRCGLLDDLALCRTLDLDVELDAEVIAAVNEGSVLYDEAAAGACLGVFGGLSCAEESLDRAESTACDQVFTGTVADGGACFIDEQCISQQCSIPSCPDACCQGTCVGGTPPPGDPQLGESCVPRDRRLVHGWRRVRERHVHRCVHRPARSRRGLPARAGPR
jgi:hypothetical protein